MEGGNDIRLDPYFCSVFTHALIKCLLCAGPLPNAVQESGEENLSPAAKQHLPFPLAQPQFPHIPHNAPSFFDGHL